MACFAIAPHFQALLEKKVKGDDYVLLFDESLNRELQNNDILVRQWEGNKVQSRYFKSAFLGHGRAWNRLIQLAMDGPNVNWALFDKLEKDMDAECDVKLVNIGSCGLHIVHNAFKDGSKATGCEVAHFLSALHTLFDDVPARREDFTVATGSCLFPLLFCHHRWVENVNVATTHVPSHLTLSNSG